MASNPYVNKVEYGGSTLMDITDTTATEGDVAAGEVFYKASGARAVGTATGGITLDDVYPVGSIYMSVSSTDPGTLFGGTWVRLTDTFLLAAGTTYAADDGTHTTATDGTATVKLTEAQTPVHAHTHSMTQPAFTMPNHTHQLPNGAVVYSTSNNNKAYTMSGSTGNYSTNTSPKLNTYNPNTNPACTRSADAAVNARVYPSGESASTVTAHNNMPPYLAVYMWKRTA